MTEERVTEVRSPEGETTHTHTTVITDKPSSGGGTWLIAVILIVALIAGIWVFSTMGGAEAAKDNAVADAANDVGNAAQQVGEAAEDAAGSLSD